MRRDVRPGATCLGSGQYCFRVWAPFAEKVDVHLVAPVVRLVPMERQERGYHEVVLEGLASGSRYLYRLDGQKERPDPASRFQPDGVHGPSQITAPDFPWEDYSWGGRRLEDYIIYELHVGTYTQEGTFEAAIGHLDELTNLGVTAVELMPVAQFPGDRNWGYDGAYPFAVQNSYGGPDGLKGLVNACHARGLAVVLDVVYNHLGPEGNYLDDFGPYFTDRYSTPWGKAVNFDGPHSDEVRDFFIQNALHWVTEYHIDALRLDAVHAIMDNSAITFLEELGMAVHERARQLGRSVYVIPESADNNARLVRPRSRGGYGLDAVWNDDFHHALHVLLTGERTGYYQDFGSLNQLAKAFAEGFVYSGQHSSYRQRRHGSPSRDIPAERLVVFAQDHDQVGNRMLGERLTSLVSFEALKLAAGVAILSPFIPLLFMGEEYGEKAPFQYFVSHSDESLVRAVREGRRREFSAFAWAGDPPDPQDPATFRLCKIDRNMREEKSNGVLLEFYRELIRLRRQTPSLRHLSKDDLEVLVHEEGQVFFWRRRSSAGDAAAVFYFADETKNVSIPLPEGGWLKLLDSADERWNGPGTSTPSLVESDGCLEASLSPFSLILFEHRPEA